MPESSKALLDWKLPIVRREVHFDDRVIKCFASRPHRFYELFSTAVATNPDGEALISDDQRLSWRDLCAISDRVASGLARRGIKPGDRVAVLLGNRSEWVIALFAIARLDAVVVPLNIREPKRALSYMLNDCHASLIFHEDEVASSVPTQAECATLRHRISIGDVPGSEPIAALLKEPVMTLPFPAAKEEDVAAILYTSGTTGQPKGVVLCNINIVHSALHYTFAMKLSRGDRSIAVVPLSHITGYIAHVAAMTCCAGALILMSRFKASEFISLARREKMTHVVLVPAMYKLILLDPSLPLLRSSPWRIAGYGGSVMAPTDIAELNSVLPSLCLMNCYGATETCSPATVMPSGMTALHSASVGKPLPCAELRVMDDSGIEQPPGKVGEIWIAGPMVAKGYWNNPDATKGGFVAGFWRSGDIGSVDEEGFVFLRDRKNDVINRGGYKIYPAEVENVIVEYPGVLECAVLSKPCPVLGERVHAVVTAENQGISVAGLRDFCVERLADYKVPESFSLRNTPLPRNPNGKLLRRVLRDELAAQFT